MHRTMKSFQPDQNGHIVDTDPSPTQADLESFLLIDPESYFLCSDAGTEYKKCHRTKADILKSKINVDHLKCLLLVQIWSLRPLLQSEELMTKKAVASSRLCSPSRSNSIHQACHLSSSNSRQTLCQHSLHHTLTKVRFPEFAYNRQVGIIRHSSLKETVCFHIPLSLPLMLPAWSPPTRASTNP
jgi:hypothetical protein